MRADVAATALPLIEPDPQPTVRVPKGYKAYILRDWHRYIVARASTVEALDDDVHLAHELSFHYGVGDGIRELRRPKYPGEVSHIFLPVAFTLPDVVRALRAQPVPSSVSVSPRRASTVVFEPDTLPPGSPPGTKAYRGTFDGFSMSGTVTGISGTPGNGFSFAEGSQVRFRKLRPGDDPVSHIVVPPGYSLPDAFIKKP
jgi:hypothetical protein